MGRSSPQVRIDHDGWSFVITNNLLKLFANDTLQVTLPLSPRVNGRKCSLGPWRRVAHDHYKATAQNLGSIHVTIRHARVACWIATRVKQIDKLTCFPGTTYNGER